MSWGQSIGEAFRAPYFKGEQLAGGLMRTASDLIPDEWGWDIDKSLAETGDEWVAEGEAFNERARRSHQYDIGGMNLANPASYATEAAAFMAPPGRLSKGGGLLKKALDYGLVGGATAYPIARSGLDTTPEQAGGEAAMVGGASAILGPAAEGIMKWAFERNIAPSALRDFDSLPSSVKNKMIKLGRSFSIDPKDLANRTADMLETTQYATRAPKGQVMKAAVQVGDTAGAKKYLSEATAEAPELAGDILREAESRYNNIMSNVSENSVVGKIIQNNTKGVGKQQRPVTDWAQVFREVNQIEGFPKSGELYNRLKTYSTLSDETFVPQLQDVRIASEVDNAYSPRALLMKAGPVKWAQELLTDLGIYGEEAKIVNRIIETASQERWTPRELSKALHESGIDPVKTGRILEETFPERTPDKPRDLDVGIEAAEPEVKMGIDTYSGPEIPPGKTYGDMVRDPETGKIAWTPETITQEMASQGVHPEWTQLAIDEGRAQGLDGGMLRNYVYNKLVNKPSQWTANR
jgi:hypothetical protein